MKIILIDSVSDLYGSSKICQLILEILREAGHDVSPFVREELRSEDERYAKKITYPLLVMNRFKKNPVKFTSKFILDFYFFWRLSRVIFRDADIVYCNTLGSIAVCLIARLRGKKVVLHIHESIKMNYLMRRLAEAIIPLFANKIIFVSKATADAWGLLAHPRCFVIHNGIPDFSSELCKTTARDDVRRYSFAFVGRLTRKKGIYVFLNALKFVDADCIRQNRRVTVVIAGGVVPGQTLPFISKEFYGFKSIDIVYLGEVDDPNHIYLNTKILCVPSTYADPYPTVVLEGLRAGCSVIASNIGGAKEALIGSISNTIVPNNSSILAHTMLEHLKIWNVSPPNNTNRAVFLYTHTIDTFKKKLLFNIECS